jgi:pimeloyl-ACP methyl ester carboxylesterase
MLTYTQNGEGNTIVLLHGFCENSTCFSKQVFFLQHDFCVITPDLPGFGNSGKLDHTGIASMADAVFDLLRKEQVSSCVMIGHSMGGYVTLEFARKYPSLLKGFGLIHSTAFADSEERKQKRDQAIRVIGEKGADSYVRNFIPPLFAPSFTDKQVLDEFIAEGLRTSEDGLTEALLSMKERNDNTLLLQQTALPVLFCIGKQDTIIPEKDMFYQASLCRQSEIVYLQNSAHMGYVEEARTCNEGIKRFATHCF